MFRHNDTSGLCKKNGHAWMPLVTDSTDAGIVVQAIRSGFVAQEVEVVEVCTRESCYRGRLIDGQEVDMRKLKTGRREGLFELRVSHPGSLQWREKEK